MKLNVQEKAAAWDKPLSKLTNEEAGYLKVAEQGWGGDAYPGETPEANLKRDYTERMHDNSWDEPEFHNWMIAGKELFVGPETHEEMRLEHGFADDDKPMAYGRLSVDHRWTVAFQIYRSNIALHTVEKILRSYAREQGYKHLGILDTDGELVSVVNERLEDSPEFHYTNGWARVAALEPVPSEPGSVPIPPNHYRLYHYTNSPEAFETIKQEGIKNSAGIGVTYGEPSQIWASHKRPGDFKQFFEFSLPADDPRLDIGKFRAGTTDNNGIPYTPETYAKEKEGTHSDVTIPYGDIEPHEIIAAHEPWHHTYRYIRDNNVDPQELQWLKERDDYPHERRALEQYEQDHHKQSKIAADPGSGWQTVPKLWVDKDEDLTADDIQGGSLQANPTKDQPLTNVPHQCPDCGIVFSDEKTMLEHINQTHNKDLHDTSDWQPVHDKGWQPTDGSGTRPGDGYGYPSNAWMF
jgi:hypothetical protein